MNGDKCKNCEHFEGGADKYDPNMGFCTVSRGTTRPHVEDRACTCQVVHCNYKCGRWQLKKEQN